jgi:hypothetical protein
MRHINIDHLIDGLWRPIFDRCTGMLLRSGDFFASQKRLELLLKKINNTK